MPQPELDAASFSIGFAYGFTPNTAPRPEPPGYFTPFIINFK